MVLAGPIITASVTLDSTGSIVKHGIAIMRYIILVMYVHRTEGVSHPTNVCATKHMEVIANRGLATESTGRALLYVVVSALASPTIYVSVRQVIMVRGANIILVMVPIPISPHGAKAIHVAMEV